MQNHDTDTCLHKQHARALGALLMSLLAANGCAAGTRLAPSGGYSLRLGAQHPLVGQVYVGQTQKQVAPGVLTTALEHTRYCVLGETHDNPDHHRLQAQLLQTFLRAHPGASVAFEMLDEDDARAMSQAPSRSADQLAERVDWADSGWPDFALYRPVVQVALRAGAPLVAASPSNVHVRESMHGVPEPEAKALQLDVPLPADQIEAQRAEIRESHCGHANAAMTEAMQHAQEYKDAFMARAMRDTGAPTALIAGRGHARNDRAVPYFLKRLQAGPSLSIAFIDVDDARLSAADYDIRAFDYVVFTPRVSDADPCEEFRKQLEKMHAPRRTASGPAGAPAKAGATTSTPRPGD